MQTHVQWSVVGCFAVLHQLCSICQSVQSSVYQSPFVALVLLRLDYGNVTLAGLLACLLNRLQSVLNAATRSITSLHHSEHIRPTYALASFHWLRAPERIKFKLKVIVYRALHGTAPQYLSDQLQYVTDLPTRRRGRLHSSTSSLLDVRPLRRVTVGDHSFSAAGRRLWNSLLADIQSFCPITRNILSETENTFISAIIPYIVL